MSNFILPALKGYAQTPLELNSLLLPQAGTMIGLSGSFSPPTLKGLKVYPDNPFQFDFIVDPGDSKFQGDAFKEESTKLIKYFLASLTIPEEDLWVNLSPYEPERIISKQLGATEMGRDLLAQDYILKQLTASLMYPEEKLGRQFWDKIYKQAQALYGTTQIPMDTFNKVWIVPDKAVVYEHGDTVFVAETHLKVMLEQDYVAMQHNRSPERSPKDGVEGEDNLALNHVITSEAKQSQEAEINDKEVNKIGSDIIREIILPAIEVEVNTGKNFASLRQIYNSLILAAWYKQALKESLLGQVYVNQSKINGVDVADKNVKEKIYAQYLEAFKKGVYDYIKEDYDSASQEIIQRKYFSGGVNAAMLTAKVLKRHKIEGDPAALGAFEEDMKDDLLVRAVGVRPDEAPEVMAGLTKIVDVASSGDQAALADAPQIPFEEQFNISLQALKTSMEAEWDKPANDVFDDLEKELLGKVIPLSQAARRYREAIDTRKRKYTEYSEKEVALEEAKRNLSLELRKPWVVKNFSPGSGKKQTELRVQIAELEAAIGSLPKEISALQRSFMTDQEQVAEFSHAVVDVFSRYDSLKEWLIPRDLPSWLVDFVINYRKMALRRKLIVGFLENPLNDNFFNSSIAYEITHPYGDDLCYANIPTAQGIMADVLERFDAFWQGQLERTLGKVEYDQWGKVKANPLFQEIFQISVEVVEESIGKRYLEILKGHRLSWDTAGADSVSSHAALAVAKLEDYDELFNNFKRHVGVENGRGYVFFPLLVHLDVQRTIRELIDLEKTWSSLPGLQGFLGSLINELRESKAEYQEQLSEPEFIKMLAAEFRANMNQSNGVAFFILDVFAQIDSPVAMDALVEEFNRYDGAKDYLIVKMAEIMAKQNPQRAFPLILARFLNHPSYDFVGSLAQSVSDENIPELIAFLDNPRQSIYDPIVRVIARMKTPAAINALLAKLRQSKRRGVSGDIERALAENIFPEALPIFIQAFREAQANQDEPEYLTSLVVILAQYGAHAKEILPTVLDRLSVIVRSEKGQEAAMKLITQGASKEDIPQLIARLSVPSSSLMVSGGSLMMIITKDKEVIIEALGIMKAEEAVSPLLDIFKDRQSFLRNEAGEALKKIGSDALIEPLTTIILDSDYPEERREKAVQILASIPSENAVEVLVGILRDHKDVDGTVQKDIVSVFETRKSASAVPVLADILKNPGIYRIVQQAVVKTLQVIGADATIATVASNLAIDHSVTMLKDKTLIDEIRLHAAEVLTHIPSLQAKQALDDAFADSTNSDELRVGIAKAATVSDAKMQVKDFTNRRDVFKMLETMYFRSTSKQDLQTSLVSLLFGRGIKPESVARFFNINIKLARYLVNDAQEGQRRRILEDRELREQINEIAYNLNREQTLHPAERRVGEDEKTNLFDYLFSLPNITQAKAVFDAYFRNDPQNYTIDILHLQTFLGYVSIDKIKKIIRTVIEDPKQSLDEILSSVKQSLQGQPDADNIIRELGWILSNLFALQDRIERLEPLAKALQGQGKTTEDLVQVLGEIDGAQTFGTLRAIAEANGFAVGDVLSFKLESVSLQKREDILADAFHSLRALSEEEAAAIYSELVGHFEVHLPQSKRRIYFKLLFLQDTNNENIAVMVNQLRSGEPLNQRIPSFIRQFLGEYSEILREDVIFTRYVDELAGLEGQDRKEAIRQLRKLYQERTFASSKMKSDAVQRAKTFLARLADGISLPEPAPQIPQVFFGPLFKIGAANESLETLRTLVTVMNNNPTMHNQLARLKTDLYDKFVTIATLNDYTERGAVIDHILEQLNGQYGQPSVENSEEFYNRLAYYLEQYTKAMDTFIKASRNDFVGTINDRLKEISGSVLEDLINHSRLNDEKIGQLQEMLAGIKSEELIASFRKRMEIEDLEAALAKLKAYAANNPKFAWRDHQGRNIYELIGYFLRTIDDPKIYKNIWDALMAEIDGRFPQWKYESEDYLATIDEIIEIEMAKLGEAEKEKLKTALEAVEGKTLNERLQGVEGFEELKAKIKKIKNWEKTVSEKIDEDLTGEFTDDFYTLFNIGNYQGSTACQSCTYGTNLNRGLTGYTVNGTNKAVALLDKDRRVTFTRRIIRLKIFEDQSGNKFPGIFVEEKATQFGVKHIDKLYEVLDQVSEATGLPIIGSVDKEAQTTAVQKGKVKELAIALRKGRSAFDYSDTYGALSLMGGGLYQQDQDRIKTPILSVRQRPMAGDEAALGNREEVRDFMSADQAALGKPEEVGGIDLNMINLKLEIKRDPQGAPLRLTPQQLEQIHLDGLTPVIINISPAPSLPAFLGIVDDQEKEESLSLSQR